MHRFEKIVKEVFDNYDHETNMILEQTKDKQIVIFGAGELGHKVYNILKSREIPVKCFCDNKLSGRTDSRTGLKVVSLNELKEEIGRLFILIAVFDAQGYFAVRRQLLEFGFENDHLKNSKMLSERLPIAYLEENLEKYREAYSLLEDDFSKEVYLNKIKKVYLHSDISDIVSDEQEEYFDKEVLLTEEEVFVDCGGFDGDTALKFIDKVNGRFKRIIIFEPDETKVNLLRERMKGYDYDFYQYGVWSRKAVLRFDVRRGLGSCISEDGKVEIETRALDDVIRDDIPTYIKMDIEGAEIEALKGGREMIQKYKPKLAVCIYHKPKDLFEIPIMLKEMCGDYRLFVRQYANSMSETVCYAV